MSDQSERYIHLKQSASDLNEARHIGLAIRDDSDNPLAEAAFMYLLVAYARPFKNSRAVSGRPFKLEPPVMSGEYAALHGRLLHARDQVLAHSDQKSRDPTLHVAEDEDRKIAIVVQAVVRGAAEIVNLDAIISLIEHNLSIILYEEIRTSEQALATTGRRRRRAV